MENLKPQALKRIQSRLVLEAVAKAENITASEEDFNKEIEEMAKNYGMTAEQIKSSMSEEEKKSMYEDLAVAKAIDFVTENAVETENAQEEAKKPARKPRKKKDEE